MLKEIPIGAEFTMNIVEPKKSLEAIAPRAQATGTSEVSATAGKKTLRMKSNGTAVVEDVPTSEVVAIVGKIDDLLDTHIGIRDQELSTTVYDLAKASAAADAFAAKLDEELADFEFPDDFVLDAYELVHGK
eukprot:m.22022 g.22022  ORF g.22022 m.22022 type:complete len:132 (+) comp9224_c1_seq1:2-397(+)